MKDFLVFLTQSWGQFDESKFEGNVVQTQEESVLKVKSKGGKVIIK